MTRRVVLVILLCLVGAAKAEAQGQKIFSEENLTVWATQARATPPLRTCEFGTVLSVNKNRQLAPGERFVKITVPPEGWIVTTTQRESPTSNTLELKRCKLAPGEHEIAVGGILPWFKKCGQDFLAEGWEVPGMRPSAIKGDKGDPGMGAVVGKAPKDACPNGGAMIADGEGKIVFVCNGKDGKNGVDGKNGLDGCPAYTSRSYDSRTGQYVPWCIPNPCPTGMTRSYNEKNGELGQCVPINPPKSGRWLTKKKILIIGGLAAGAGYGAWYYYYCPPGTVRR